MKYVRDRFAFRKARERMGLTKVDLAALMDLPRPGITGSNTIRRWEDGTVKIPGPSRRLMEALLTGWRPLDWKGK